MNLGTLVKGAAKQLQVRPKLEKTLYFASSNEGGREVEQFAEMLTQDAPQGLHWHFEDAGGKARDDLSSGGAARVPCGLRAAAESK